MLTIETNDPTQTAAFAEIFGKRLKAGDIVALDGDLGAGKTVFSKGIACSLGITEPVTSPTFIIIQEYKTGRIPLYHFDVYRIDDPEELYEIGADEYFGGDGLCLIEWASRIEDILPDERIRIMIHRNNDIGFDHRAIQINGLSKEDEIGIMEDWRTYENTCN